LRGTSQTPTRVWSLIGNSASANADSSRGAAGLGSDVRTMADLNDVTTGFSRAASHRMRARPVHQPPRAFFQSHSSSTTHRRSTGGTDCAPRPRRRIDRRLTTTGATLAAMACWSRRRVILPATAISLLERRRLDTRRRARPRASSSIPSRHGRGPTYREVRTRFRRGRWPAP